MLAGMGLWACNTDDLDAADANDGLEAAVENCMTFKASVGGKSLSKSTMSIATGETKFSEDDNIKIFTLDGKNAQFNVSNISNDCSEATFSGDIATSAGYYAMLPYQANATISGNEITMNIPSEQDSKYEDLMVGYTSNSDRSFQFRHVGAMIKFVTRQVYRSITIESLDGTTPIAGDVKVTVGTDGKPTVTGGTATKITVTTTDKTTDSVLVTLLPIKNVRLKFTFEKKDGTKFPQELDARTLISGTMYTYNQVGQRKVICYADESKSQILFSGYTSDRESYGLFTWPECDKLTPQPGQAYGYTKTPGGTIQYKPHNTSSNIKDNITEVYPAWGTAQTVTVYCNGNDKEPVVKEVLQSSTVKLPEITITPEEGYGYGYASSPTSTIVLYESGANVSVQRADITLYIIKTKLKAFNVYFDGPDSDPKTYYILPKAKDCTFTLPDLLQKDGYYAGYSSSATSKDFVYYPGELINVADLSGNTFNYYAVYRQYLDITEVQEYKFNGATLGNENLTGEKVYMQTMPQIPVGTCMVFKFTNKCQETSQSNTNENTCVKLCGEKVSNTSMGKEIVIFNSRHGEKSGTIPAQNYYMANINNTEVTVKISNHGGIADVEYSWTGSIDKQQYNIKYSNICIWDNLYVSFAAYKSYITLE